MNITITLTEEDQSLQAEILKVLLKSDKSDKSDKTPKPTEKPTTKPAQKPTDQPAPKPYPLPTDPAPSDPSDPSDTTQKSDETPKPAEQPTAETPTISMEDLRKSVNAISRTKGLNWLYSWLGDLGVKSIAEIPAERLEEANTKLQNYK